MFFFKIIDGMIYFDNKHIGKICSESETLETVPTKYRSNYFGITQLAECLKRQKLLYA